jgi:hypothetical protein
MNDFTRILNFGLTIIFCVIPYIAFMLYSARKGIAARKKLALRLQEARESGKLQLETTPRNTIITRFLALGALLVLAALLAGLSIVVVWPTLMPPTFSVIVFAVLFVTGIAIGVALYRTMTRVL